MCCDQDWLKCRAVIRVQIKHCLYTALHSEHEARGCEACNNRKTHMYAKRTM